MGRREFLAGDRRNRRLVEPPGPGWGDACLAWNQPSVANHRMASHDTFVSARRMTGLPRSCAVAMLLATAASAPSAQSAWTVTPMAHAVGVLTHADPVPYGDRLTELRVVH